MIDLHYFGNVNYFNILSKNLFDEFSINQLYQKGCFTNKTIITGANGNIILSVPLQGGRNQKAFLKDVKMAYDTNWRQQHKKAIFSCYGNAPFFEYYQFLFEQIFQQKFIYLIDLNFYILEKIEKILQLKIEIRKDENQTKDEVIMCSKDYFKCLNEEMQQIKYQQVFEDRNGFQSNLSIIDLLLCEGPNAKNLLKM